MAIIKCPECGYAVSDKAAACPHCAYPVAETSQGRRTVQVIEQTGRTWKHVRVLGWLLISVGVLVLLEGWAADHSRGLAVGWDLGLMGVACLWISRAGAWWYHG
jgi:hypothetical protein